MTRTAQGSHHFIEEDSTGGAGPVAGVLDDQGQPLTTYGQYGRGYYGQGTYGGHMSDTTIKRRHAEVV